jgi:hypothetical protein
MPIIITITNEIIAITNRHTYEYKTDRVLKNIVNGSYEIFYSGQNQGKADYKLLDAIADGDVFHIYHRTKKTRDSLILVNANPVELSNIARYLSVKTRTLMNYYNFIS